MSAPIRKRVEVAAAVIMQPDGQFLLGQRAPDTVYAGYWEFPGGKVEAGETPHDALVRELDEELGIRVQAANPWITREYHYEHAHVRLHFFEVSAWQGEPKSHIHSALCWQRAQAPSVHPMLPANAPVLRALQLPRVYGITQAAEVGVEAQLALLDAALSQGLGMVQVREGRLSPSARQEFAQAVRSQTRARGALMLVNDDEVLARAVGADGLHVPAARLMSLQARPDFEWVGASAHNPQELARAAELGLDFVVLGPVKPTLSHPGAAGMGWEVFADMIGDYPLPVFAIGGVTEADMGQARRAGAHGIAGIRGVWGR